MAIDDKIRDEKLQHDINRKEKQPKYHHYHQAELININVLQVKNYHQLIRVD